MLPGPPCNKSTLIVGLLPKRLVQTLNFPFGVLMLIIFIPPVFTKAVSVLLKYSFAVICLEELVQPEFKMKAIINIAIIKRI